MEKLICIRIFADYYPRNNLFFISGTDIVRCLSFRFQAFGRPVKNSKKFEEGIFSDLRNLKSGTHASLEEPKSPFLDFLYKNNCIRTQKKQKVFYWYSVPHDRLFLDALERDLKREKMNQEATTEAVNEPALSFEFDSSQSLFDQLTKSQQANSSSFSAQPNSYTQSQSTSPEMRAIDSMPPPQMTQMVPQTMAPLEDISQMNFSQMAMPQTVAQQVVKRETDYGRMQYNPNGVLPLAHQRHASMPAYGMEYSPAPSFVSSHYDDYSQRGISFEPLTPPQQAMHMNGEPAYIANEETGLYTAIPDHMNVMSSGMMQIPPSNLSNPQFTHGTRGYGAQNVYSIIEGSPTYKQRRRRSSIPPGMAGVVANAQPNAVHRPSDLRRSVSILPECDESNDTSPPGLSYSTQIGQMAQQHKDLLELSRHGTPHSDRHESPAINPMVVHQQQDFSQLSNNDFNDVQESCRRPSNLANGMFRRARSATMMELGTPYSQKSHSCPIPTCGRVFKRLEHLKRHVRTHTHERPYLCPHCNKSFSRSDNLAQHRRTHERSDGSEGPYTFEEEEEMDDEVYEGEVEEVINNLEGTELSPDSEGSYMQDSNMGQSMQGMSAGAFSLSGMTMGTLAPSQLVQAQSELVG